MVVLGLELQLRGEGTAKCGPSYALRLAKMLIVLSNLF